MLPKSAWVVRHWMLLGIATLSLSVFACARLPDDYEDLPLDSKLAALVEYRSSFGLGYLPLEPIADHGIEAAEKIAAMLEVPSPGDPDSDDLLRVVSLLYLGGCQLEATGLDAGLAALERRTTTETSVRERVAEMRPVLAKSNTLPVSISACR